MGEYFNNLFGSKNRQIMAFFPTIAVTFALILASCSGAKKNNASEGSIGVSLYPPSTSNLSNEADSVGNFNSIDFSTINTVIPVHIGFRAESAGGKVFQTDLTNSEEASVSLPFGRVRVTVSYLALGTAGVSQEAYCSAKKNNTNTPESVTLYSEFTNVFNIDSSTNQILISFTNPFNVINPEDKFGFTFVDGNNKPLEKVKLGYVDPISNSSIKDPCTNNEFSDESNEKGKLAVNFPLYSPSRTMNFKVQSGENVYLVNAQLERARLNPAFYTFKLSNPVSSVSPTPDSESFLDNNISNKDTLAAKLNPRFPQIKYEIATPFLDQQGQLFIPFFKNIGEKNDRKLNVVCRVQSSNANDTNYARFANFGNCTAINPFPKVTAGATYRITAFLQDSEGFIASNQATNTLVVPAAPTNTTNTSTTTNTTIPDVVVAGAPAAISVGGVSNLFNNVIYIPSQNLNLTFTGGTSTTTYSWTLQNTLVDCSTIAAGSYSTPSLLNVPLAISSSLNTQGQKRLCLAFRHNASSNLIYRNFDWFVETRTPLATISGHPTASYSGSLGVNIVIGSNLTTNAPVTHYFYHYFSTPSTPSSTACASVTLNNGNIGVNGTGGFIGVNWIGPVSVNTLITSQMSPPSSQNRALCVRGVSPTGVVQPTNTFVSWPNP